VRLKVIVGRVRRGIHQNYQPNNPRPVFLEHSVRDLRTCVLVSILHANVLSIPVFFNLYQGFSNKNRCLQRTKTLVMPVDSRERGRHTWRQLFLQCFERLSGVFNFRIDRIFSHQTSYLSLSAGKPAYRRIGSIVRIVWAGESTALRPRYLQTRTMHLRSERRFKSLWQLGSYFSVCSNYH
jgi:hypothetical protein